MKSQDSAVLNKDHSLLFVVNTTSDEISIFSVDPDTFELTFVQRVPPGGDRSPSLNVVDDLVYVLYTGFNATAELRNCSSLHEHRIFL